MGQVSARTHNTSAQISATTAKSLPVNFQFFMDTLASLLAFHKVEREVFRRLIDMGLNPQVARNIICLWLWLEEIGFYDMVRQISIQSNEFLALVAAEAEAAFTFIEPDGMAPTAYVRLPLTSQLANTPLSLNYFSLVKRDAFHGVSNTLNRVGNIIFNDILEERGRVDTGNGGAMAGAQAEMTSASAAQLMGRTQVWPFGEGTNGLGSGGIGNTGLFEVSGLFGMPTTGDGTSQQKPEHVASGLPGIPGFEMWVRPPAAAISTPAGAERLAGGMLPLTRNEAMDFNFSSIRYGRESSESVYVDEAKQGEGPVVSTTVSVNVTSIVEGNEKEESDVAGKPGWCNTRFQTRN